jgi:tetratricopeptide (TPR) repeat protein
MFLSCAQASTREDAQGCAVGPVDARIAACTRLTGAKGLDAKNLGAVYFDRANAHREKGATDLAIADYSEAIKLRPDLAEAYNSRGLLLKARGEFDRAVDDFDAAVRIKPDFADALLNGGTAKEGKGDLRGAVTDYDAVIRLKPEDVQAYLDRGIAEGDERIFKSALADFSAAAKLAPQAAEGFSGVCWIAAISGIGPEQAIQDCDRAVALRPGDPAVLGYRALLWLRLGDLDSATSDYDSAIQKHRDATLLFGRGIAELRNGNPTGAREDFAQARDLDPRVAQTYAGYGIAP